MLSAAEQIEKIQSLSYSQLIEEIQKKPCIFADDLIAMEMNRRDEISRMTNEQIEEENRKLKKQLDIRQYYAIIQNQIEFIRSQVETFGSPDDPRPVETFEDYTGNYIRRTILTDEEYLEFQEGLNQLERAMDESWMNWTGNF